MAAARRVLARFGWRPWHYLTLLLIHVDLLRFARMAGRYDWGWFFCPWADLLRISILKYHQFPWWNPWAMAGQPFFAEPQTSVLMPDTLFTLAFGSVVGLKVAILFYLFVGYEGSRALCRLLFGKSTFVDGSAIIPVILPALALHLSAGHIGLSGGTYLFPWLLTLAMTWQRSRWTSLALGGLLGVYTLYHIQYGIIISLSLAFPVAVMGLWRRPRSSEIWLKVALVACTAMTLGFLRLASTLDIVARFPRVDPEHWHYPVVNSVSGVLATLVDPMQTNADGPPIANLGWWELGSYTGLCALLIAYESLRSGVRKMWPIHFATLLCFLLAWNNRDKAFPGYWLHVIPPWKYMTNPTRWRIFGCYFLLLTTVHGLVTIRNAGRLRTAALLAAFVVADLGFNTYYAYKGVFASNAPPFVEAADPPATVDDSPDEAWTDVRKNRVAMGIVNPLLGYALHRPSRTAASNAHYRGEFYGNKPVKVESWSPNRVVLVGTPGDQVTLNVNPSNYWLLNGQRLFPTFRAFEIDKPFQITVPPGGRMDLRARPPHWELFAAIQGLFGVAAAFLFWLLKLAARDNTSALAERPAIGR
jgi:hypothetical protein